MSNDEPQDALAELRSLWPELRQLVDGFTMNSDWNNEWDARTRQRMIDFGMKHLVAAPSGIASTSAELSESGTEDAAQTSEQDEREMGWIWDGDQWQKPVHQAGSQECAPAAREADSRSLADGDYARIAEACGANVRWHGGGLSFLASDWGRFCDRLRAAPSGVPQDSAPLPLSVSSGRSAADTPLRSQPQSGDEVRE
jgi:hypothetical protein